MKVTGNPYATYPKLSGERQPTVWQTGSKLPVPEVPRDLLEISDEGRRKLDLIDKEATKISIPESPKDDVNEIMKMFRPETYEKMKEHLDRGDVKEGLSVLLSFAKELAKHPDWIREYREAAQK